MTRILKMGFFALTVVFFIQSCSSNLDLEPEDGRLVGDAAFEDPASYRAFLAKIYAGISLSGQDGPAGDPDLAGLDEGFSNYLRLYWKMQQLTTDEAIIAAIKAKTVTWNKISDLLIKPYEAVCFKEIGTYDNIPPPPTQEFTITNSASSPSSQPQDKSAIEEINKEEAYPPPRSSADKKSAQQE